MWNDNEIKKQLFQAHDDSGDDSGMVIVRTSIETVSQSARFIAGLRRSQLASWYQGELIQLAMPNVSQSDREYLITGIVDVRDDRWIPIEVIHTIQTLAAMFPSAKIEGLVRALIVRHSKNYPEVQRYLRAIVRRYSDGVYFDSYNL
jgi:hypothetical protein